jgi:hypothetical protein
MTTNFKMKEPQFFALKITLDICLDFSLINQD